MLEETGDVVPTAALAVVQLKKSTPFRVSVCLLVSCIQTLSGTYSRLKEPERAISVLERVTLLLLLFNYSNF